MQKIEIKISKTEILDKVSLASAYAGAKNEGDAGLFDRVATIDADKQLLSEFWSEICGLIIDKLRGFIDSVDNSDLAFILNLQLSNAYDDALTPSVTEDLCALFVTGICGRWFRFTFPGKSSEWLSQSEELMKRVVSKLCFRRKPKRG